MSEILNLNNVSVDDSGRVTVSGASSGIDIQGTVDAIIAARQIPVDNLEIQIEHKTLHLALNAGLRSLVNEKLAEKRRQQWFHFWRKNANSETS